MNAKSTDLAQFDVVGQIGRRRAEGIKRCAVIMHLDDEFARFGHQMDIQLMGLAVGKSVADRIGEDLVYRHVDTLDIVLPDGMPGEKCRNLSKHSWDRVQIVGYYQCRASAGTILGPEKQCSGAPACTAFDRSVHHLAEALDRDFG